MERHHSRRREDGFGGVEQRGAEDYGDRRRLVSAPDTYAMCGKAYDPRFIFAWPTARYAVMSGASAANTLVEVRIKQLERGGKQLTRGGEKGAVRLHQGDL